MRVPVNYKGVIKFLCLRFCTQNCYRGSNFFFFFFKSIPLKGAVKGATLVHSKNTKGRAKKKEKRRKIREGLRVSSKFMSTR